MENQKKDAKKDIQTRLRRIEGQVKGIEKMIENECCCRDVLIQVAAIRAAMNKVGGLVLENYAKQCFLGGEDKEKDEAIEELVSTFTMFMK